MNKPFALMALVYCLWSLISWYPYWLKFPALWLGVAAAYAVEKPVTQKALGLDLAILSKDLRTRYKIKDSVKGVIVTGVDSGSDAAGKRLSAGDVIVEVAQESVASAADIKKRVDQLKKDGKKSVLLLVSNAEGELRFVALGVQ